jgi:hypothetical protein
MFLPAGTKVHCIRRNEHRHEQSRIRGVVVEVVSDFDFENINGIKIRPDSTADDGKWLSVSKETYIDDIHYEIQVTHFPETYYVPFHHYLVVFDKLNNCHHFCTDGTYRDNRWMKFQTDIVEKIPEVGMSYRAAYRNFKTKYLK